MAPLVNMVAIPIVVFKGRYKGQRYIKVKDKTLDFTAGPWYLWAKTEPYPAWRIVNLVKPPASSIWFPSHFSVDALGHGTCFIGQRKAKLTNLLIDIGNRVGYTGLDEHAGTRYFEFPI